MQQLWETNHLCRNELILPALAVNTLLVKKNQNCDSYILLRAYQLWEETSSSGYIKDSQRDQM